MLATLIATRRGDLATDRTWDMGARSIHLVDLLLLVHFLSPRDFDDWSSDIYKIWILQL
jgi:hypothetical protein